MRDAHLTFVGNETVDVLVNGVEEALPAIVAVTDEGAMFWIHADPTDPLILRVQGLWSSRVTSILQRPDSRIVVLTGYGAIATAVAAVKIGATDYLSKPADATDITNALLANGADLPPPPENPMSADRVRWEHIQRVYELCDRNVSETARRLNMHRRTLQRILAKRSPK